MDVCHLGELSDRKTIYMQIEHKIQASDMPRGARRVWPGTSAVYCITDILILFKLVFVLLLNLYLYIY